MVREEINERIRASLQESSFDAVLVNGADNIQYLSGAPLPFLYSYPDRYMGVFWPKRDEPTAILPLEWENSFENMSWMNRTRPYTETPGNTRPYVEAVAHIAKTTIRKTRKIGVDMARTSQVLYDRLTKVLEDFELVSCDGLLKDLRVTKTAKELSLLERVALSADHGIFGAAHHVLVKSPKTEMSLGEDIRVHCMERELDVVGHHSVSQAASGIHATKLWPLAPNYGVGYDKEFRPMEFVRMEARVSRNGYWGDAARMMTMGEPTETQKAAYHGLVTLRRGALESIKPGNKLSQVYHSMKSSAAEKGIDLIDGLYLGHGVGVTDREPPYVSASDESEIKPGMILVLDPLIRGPADEILRSKDTVIVTEDEARVVGWYVNWRMPYVANDTL